ncbi:MAG: hypothetical protein R3A47_10725 [Polyangiales bacterium]
MIRQLPTTEEDFYTRDDEVLEGYRKLERSVTNLTFTFRASGSHRGVRGGTSPLRAFGGEGVAAVEKEIATHEEQVDRYQTNHRARTRARSGKNFMSASATADTNTKHPSGSSTQRSSKKNTRASRN